MTVVVLLALLVLLAATAARWGADSRDGRDWQRCAPPTARGGSAACR